MLLDVLFVLFGRAARQVERIHPRGTQTCGRHCRVLSASVTSTPIDSHGDGSPLARPPAEGEEGIGANRQLYYELLAVSLRCSEHRLNVKCERRC
jgi:hypothetical protein